MKRFQFSLATLLRLRQQEANQARRSLGEAAQSLTAAKEQLEKARQQFLDGIERARALEAEGLSVNQFSMIRSHLSTVQGDAVHAERGVIQAVAEFDRQRHLLLLSRQKERALERLKERRMEQYAREWLRFEQRELDEMARGQLLNPSGRAFDSKGGEG